MNTKAGGKKAAKTIKEKYGKDYYKNMGHLGGKAGHTGGFFGKPEKARLAGMKGGRKSKRTYTEEQRLEASIRMKQAWRAKRELETLFVTEEVEFGEGFNQPRWIDRVYSKFRRENVN